MSARDRLDPADLALIDVDVADDGLSGRFELVRGLVRHDGGLYGGTGLAVSVLAMQAASGRDVLWATTQFVSSPHDGRRGRVAHGRARRGPPLEPAHGDGVVRRGTGLHRRSVRPASRATTGLTGQYRPMPVASPPDDGRLVGLARAEPGSRTAGASSSTCGRRPSRVTRPRTGLWVRRRDGLPFTPAGVAFAADFVPLGIARAAGKQGAGSSLDNSMRFRADGGTEWLLLELHADFASGGYGHGTVRAWSQDGQLLASGSQTAAMRYLWAEGEMPLIPDTGATAERPTNVRVTFGEGTAMSTEVGELDPALFLPEPEPRTVLATIISVDDHLVEPPDLFEGRLPVPAAGPGPEGGGRPARPRGVGVRRAAPQPGRHERRRRSPARDGAGRAVPVRPDAARVLRHRGPGAGHGPQRRVGLDELPVDDHRVLRTGVLAVLGPRARAGHHPGVQRLGPRRVVAAPSRADHPARHHLAGRPGARARRRCGATPSGASAPSPCPSGPHQIGLPSIFDEHWAPILEACADTGTVVCLHVGSSGLGELPPGCDRAIVPLAATLFGQVSLQACTEWLWAGLDRALPRT